MEVPGAPVEREDLQELLDLMDKNYLGWASFMAPLVMGAEASPDLVDEQRRSFCATDIRAARAFPHATLFSDYRHILSDTRHPTLILQSETDALAQPHIGRYMHERMPGSTFSIIQAEGHCLQMTHPAEVAECTSFRTWIPKNSPVAA